MNMHAVLTISVIAISIALSGAVASFGLALFRPYAPFADVERIVRVERIGVDGSRRGVPLGVGQLVAGQREWVEDHAILDWEPNAAVEYQGQVRQVSRYWSTAGLFRMARPRPLLGRGLIDADSLPGAAPGAVLAYRLWVSAFAADSGVLGRTFRIDGAVYQIVGVMPEGFSYPEASIWLAFSPERLARSRVSARCCSLLLKTRSGITDTYATEAVRLAAARADTESRSWRGAVTPISSMAGELPAGSLYAPIALCSLVLLVAIANVAGLFVSRSLASQRGWAIRLAVGATHPHIIFSVAAESLALSLAGGVLGVILTALANSALGQLLPDVVAPHLNMGLAVALTALGILVGLLASFFPIAHVFGTDPAGLLTGRAATGRKPRLGLAHFTLVTAQLSLAVAAVTLATRFAAGHPKFGVGSSDPDMAGISSLEFSTAGSTMLRADRSASTRLSEGMARLPGVVGVTVIRRTTRPNAEVRFQSEDPKPLGTVGTRMTLDHIVTDDNTLAVLRLHVLQGRFVSRSDVQAAERVVAVSKAAARGLFGSAEAVGRIIMVRAGDREVPVRVVGVVTDFRFAPEYQRDPPAIFYDRVELDSGEPFEAYVRATPSDGPSLTTLGHRAAEALEGTLPNVRSMALRVSGADRLAMRTATWVAVGALSCLALAIAGLHALASLALQRRAREIGIRRALGSGPLRIVIAEGRTLTKVACLGTGTGLFVAWSAARLLSAGTADLDLGATAMASAGACVILSLTLVTGVGGPMIRSLRSNPADILRSE